MKAVFRVDASLHIGLGHVMRCLALANELKRYGTTSLFLCRDHESNPQRLLEERGYVVKLLPRQEKQSESKSENPAHANWLGASWQQDAADCLKALGEEQYDWLIVDHYGIDYRWHEKIRKKAKAIMAIDDLADRKLDCDLLLDQTHGRDESDYLSLIPSACQLKLGAKYALLRSEFSINREMALEKRVAFHGLRRLLVFMGGGDPENITGEVLETLGRTEWPERRSPVIDVVLGGQAPHWQAIEKQAQRLPIEINVLSGVSNMADLMLNADLAIGAGGTASWERCAMALPAIIKITADNQRFLSGLLHKAGAVELWHDEASLMLGLKSISADSQKWLQMKDAAAVICDGLGVQRIAKILCRC